jgi:hypothetical protein
MHAALRWVIARQDGDAALRFVLALGWYWMLRGQPGEPEALAQAVLALEPRERSARMAEARMVCALTAAGPMWEMNTVRPAVTAAAADFAERSDDGLMTHPLAAMGEPMLPGEADQLPDLVGVAEHVVAADGGLAAVRPEQRGQDAHRGRLAGPVGSEYPQYPALPGHQIHPVQRGRPAEPLDQPGGLDRVA